MDKFSDLFTDKPNRAILDLRKVWIAAMEERPKDYPGPVYWASIKVGLLGSGVWFTDEDSYFMRAVEMLGIESMNLIDEPDSIKESAAVYALYVTLLKELWGISEDEITAQQLPDAINTA